MCAKRQPQSFQTSNSSFWRQTGGAIPGRVNLAKTGGVVGGGNAGVRAGGGGGASKSSAAAHSFNNFQESVSDAWDIEEPLTPPVKKVERVLESVHQHRVSTTQPPAISDLVGTGTAAAITPLQSADENKVTTGGGGGGAAGIAALSISGQNSTGRIFNEIK